MVVYPVFFPLLSTLTWDTFLTLRDTQGFYLNYVLPWMLITSTTSMIDNVFTEQGRLIHFLPLVVHQKCLLMDK